MKRPAVLAALGLSLFGTGAAMRLPRRWPASICTPTRWPRRHWPASTVA